MEFNRDYLINSIKENLLILWTNDAIYDNSNLYQEDVCKMLTDFSDIITSMIDEIEEIDDAILKDAIIDLTNLSNKDTRKSRKVLSDVLYRLINVEYLEQRSMEIINRKVCILEVEIDKLMKHIKSTECLKHAEPYFGFLERIQIVLSNLAFIEGANLSNRTKRFVHDFERIDDTLVLQSLYKEIKEGRYIN